VCRAASRGVGVTGVVTEGASTHVVAHAGASWPSEVVVSIGGQRAGACARRAATGVVAIEGYCY
jgi:hypothetical protein